MARAKNSDMTFLFLLILILLVYLFTMPKFITFMKILMASNITFAKGSGMGYGGGGGKSW